MRHISIKPFYGNVFLKDKVFEINNGHNIFFEFDQKMKKRKVVVHTNDLSNDKKTDKLIYVDIPYPWQISLWLKIILTHSSKNILYCFESPLVNPFNHMRILHCFFSKVVTWNDDLARRTGYLKFNIPQIKRNKVSKIKFERKKFLTAVYSNKSTPAIFGNMSKYKIDLYQLRYELFRQLDETNVEFHLYGRGWNTKRPFNLQDKWQSWKRFDSYKGEIKDKLEVISKYKYCLAFENAVAPGYITEKIFDCFLAGCVPVYYGAPNIEKYIPSNTFIDYRELGSMEKLVAYLVNIDKSTYSNYLQNAKYFLSLKDTKYHWFENGFSDQFFSLIVDK